MNGPLRPIEDTGTIYFEKKLGRFPDRGNLLLVRQSAGRHDVTFADAATCRSIESSLQWVLDVHVARERLPESKGARHIASCPAKARARLPAQGNPASKASPALRNKTCKATSPQRHIERPPIPDVYATALARKPGNRKSLHR